MLLILSQINSLAEDALGYLNNEVIVVGFVIQLLEECPSIFKQFKNIWVFTFLFLFALVIALISTRLAIYGKHHMPSGFLVFLSRLVALW